MAIEQFDIKQHDLEPPLIVTCLDDNAPVDLSTALSARFLMRNLSGLKVNAMCEILDQTDEDLWGKVKYVWTGSDTETVGTYNGEIEIIWPGNRPQTFPSAKSAKYFKVNIWNDLTD